MNKFIISDKYELVKVQKGTINRYEIRIIGTGEVVSTRHSTRDYVACIAPNGDKYFGRMDLVEKEFARKYYTGAAELEAMGIINAYPYEIAILKP